MRALLIGLSLCAIQCGSNTPNGGGGDGPMSSTDLAQPGGSTDLAQSASTDLAVSQSTDMAIFTGGEDLTSNGLCCGQPGDVGNNLGVGKYCPTLGDCTGMANICASLGDSELHFCTMICQLGGHCGAGAPCQCQGGQCGCFPDSCLSMPANC